MEDFGKVIENGAGRDKIFTNYKKRVVMKTKFLIAVIALLFGASFNSMAQQKKGKKVYHKRHHHHPTHTHPQGPVVLLPPPPPRPGTHPSRASMKPRVVRLPAPPKPKLPPPPPHPGGGKK